MAKRQKGVKFPIDADKAQEILNMDPKLLGNEIARMQVRIDTQKEDIKENAELKNLINIKDAIEADIVENDPEVQKLKTQLEDLKQKIKETATSEKLEEAKKDVKLLRSAMSKDLNTDKKILKFMVKTFKSHWHSGAIKLEVK